MVDSETTDTDPNSGGVLQLAAIKFNLETMEIGDTFDRCPDLLPQKRWSDSTREFWSKHKSVYHSIVARQEDARGVYQAFADWVCKDGPLIFVAKPVKFDWPMIEAQYLQLGIVFPFAHYHYLDMNSYMLGLRGNLDFVQDIPFPSGGAQHNALHDCAYQLDVLFHAKRGHVHAELVG